ncbi:MAG: PEP-CTERM sorting domain-containing protein [Proteobacteria bacterium]|nr:PEP-CTERM sorting domain-containing protein [Pseudomonadota bacterium]
MKNSIAVSCMGLLLLVAGTANALTFNEVQGTSFERILSVTPTTTNKMLFSVSGLGTQFSDLSFSFTGTGLSVAATPSGNALSGAFNDIRNGGYSFTGGTTYQVKVSGHTTANIPGGSGTVSVTAMNAIMTAVPEPESYAMLLAGLGLIGTVVRRGRQR